MDYVSETVRKIDRRVIKTRKAIMEAFNRLVSRNSMEKITVSAIAREADIDRKTFYLHYSSIDDLAHCKAKEGIERVLKVLRAQGAETTDEERLDALLGEVNTILTTETNLYSSIAKRLSTEQMLAYFEETAGSVLSHLNIPCNLDTDIELHRRLQFYLAGAWSLYSDWLTSATSEPIEAISDAVRSAVMSAPAVLGGAENR